MPKWENIIFNVCVVTFDICDDNWTQIRRNLCFLSYTSMICLSSMNTSLWNVTPNAPRSIWSYRLRTQYGVFMYEHQRIRTIVICSLCNTATPLRPRWQDLSELSHMIVVCFQTASCCSFCLQQHSVRSDKPVWRTSMMLWVPSWIYQAWKAAT